MNRGTIMMIVGISMQIINWIFSYTSSQASSLTAANQSAKSLVGMVTIAGWIIFFAGIGIRQLDKRRSVNNSTKKKQ